MMTTVCLWWWQSRPTWLKLLFPALPFEINTMVSTDACSYFSVYWIQMEALLFIYPLPWWVLILEHYRWWFSFSYSCTPLIQLLWNRKLRLADLRANQLRFIEHTFWKKSQVFKHNVRTYLQQAIPSLNGCGSLLPQSHFCYLQPQSEDLKAEETGREQQRWVIRPFTVYEMKRHTISGHQKQDTKWSQRISQSWDMTGLKHQHVEKENKDSLF